MLDGLQQLAAQHGGAGVLGQIQQVEAGMGYRQVLLTSTRGLDDQLQALHAQDGDAVTSCKEHYTYTHTQS